MTKPSDTWPVPQASTEETQHTFAAAVQQEIDGTQFDDGMQSNIVYIENATADAQALLDLYNTTGYNQHTIPAFFEQIMVPAPDFMGVDFMQPPPDLTAWMPEVDWLGQVDIFGNDFTPAIDQMLETQVTRDAVVPAETNEASVAETSLEKIDNNSAKRRHAVFKQSPWSVTSAITSNGR